MYTCIYIYIYICYLPLRYPGLGLVQMCFDRGSRQEEQLRFAHWETRGRRFASLKKDALDVTHALFQWLFHTKFNSHIFPHKPGLLSKALPQIIHISSHTNHALFQRLFHIKFTHPLTQQMSFYMSSFNDTKAAYVKELPRKGNPVYIFPHKPCLHLTQNMFQRLFHIKFTHPLTQHMSFYMSSFNETKSAYVKELPRKAHKPLLSKEPCVE